MPQPTLIALIAYSLTGDEHRFLEAGCDEYYSKPIKKEILESTLQDNKWKEDEQMTIRQGTWLNLK
ncbi:MAG: hypothetical protein Q7U59_01570 [Lutibacter sp.]|nr:hypothetical protein [Lutibacter sp.]